MAPCPLKRNQPSIGAMEIFGFVSRFHRHQKVVGQRYTVCCKDGHVCVRENATVIQRFACSLQKKNRQIGRQMVNYDQLLFHVVSGIVYIVDSISVVMTVFIEEFMKLVRFPLVRMQFIFKPPSCNAKLSIKHHQTKA